MFNALGPFGMRVQGVSIFGCERGLADIGLGFQISQPRHIVTVRQSA